MTHFEQNQHDAEQTTESPAALTPYNTFDLIPAQHSATIYRQFVQGKVITKQIYNEVKAIPEDNPLFTLLFSQQAHFENLYQHLGYELCFESDGDFYYIRELREESSDEADDNALKVQTILLLLGRYFAGTGRELKLLLDPIFGVGEHDIKALKENDEFKAILKAVRVDNWQKAMEFLVARNFAFKTGHQAWLLSKASGAYLFRLVDEYEKWSN